MTTDPRDIELIERYLDNLLSREDRAAFEKRVAEDPGFKELFELRKALPSLMANARKLEQTRKEVRHSIKTTIPIFSMPLRPAYFAWAAVVILLLGICFIYFFATKEGRPPENKPSDVASKQDTLILIPGEKPAFKANKMVADSGNHEGIYLVLPPEGRIFNTGDSILFSWMPSPDTTTDLNILFRATQKNAYRTILKPGQKKFTLQQGTLRPGNYEWYIGIGKKRRTFTITNVSM